MFDDKKEPALTEITDVYAAWTPEPLASAQRKQQANDKKNVIVSNLVDVIRSEFFEKINASIAATLDKEHLTEQVNRAVSEIVDRHKFPLNWSEQNLIVQDLLHDMLGVGPIESLLKEVSVTDILVNGPDKIFVERNGVLELTDLSFRDELHLLEVARRIAASVGRRIDETSPMVDARLEDGSRVNIIIAPLSVKGTILSIRKFPKDVLSLADLANANAMSEQMASFLEIVSEARLNILVSGGTGAGKTTLLNSLSKHIRSAERVVTIEDAAEINLQKPHVISLETRQRNVEGTGEVSQRDLLRNALRMRPDRIIIGEVRGAEAHEMLQAMNTGHDGSMSTIHANSPRDALIRLEDLVMSHYSSFQPQTIRRQIASSIDLLIHVARDYKGQRFIQFISEVVGLEGDVVVLQDLFTAEMNSSDLGIPIPIQSFKRQLVRPICMSKVEQQGLGNRMREILNA